MKESLLHRWRKFPIALRVTIVYLIAGFLWIILSDYFLIELPGFYRSDLADSIQQMKGIFFVLVTGALLFYYVGRQERRLIKSESLYRLLAENAQDLIYRYRFADPPGFEYVSPSSTTFTGYTPQEHYDDPNLGQRLVHPDDLPLLQKLAEGEIAEGESLVLRWIRKDGSTIWTEQKTTLYRDERGRPIGVEGIARDITKRKEVEIYLRESEEVLLQAQAIANLGSWFFDLDEQVVHATETAQRIYGLTGEQWSIATVQTFPLEKYRPTLDRALKELVQQGKPYDVTFEIRHGETGEIRTVHSVATYDPSRNRIIGVIHDITEQVEAEKRNAELEAELRQSQKLEAIGRLAGGVAHDFNNMLAVIMSSVDFALSSAPKGSEIHEDLLEIDRAAQRSADLTRQLLAFSRRQIIDPKPIKLNQAIQEQQKMLGRLIGEDIAIRLHLRQDLWPVFIDHSQVDQILANLAVNARDAIGGVGTLTIETDNTSLSEQFSRQDMPVEEGEYVMLSVSDTGNGMTEEVMERIFEPFYTTKPHGEGTGLGLATVYGIVKQNRGVIHVYSEPGMGSTFKIYLPRCTGQVAAKSVDRSPESLEGTETVLIVEDDDALLKLATRFLTRCGYTVFGASSPREALEQISGQDQPLHLLITDVVMPGMNGKELQQRVEEIIGATPTLFMSGYTANVIAQRGVLEEGIEFIQKPFTMKHLVQRMREILD